MDDDDDDEDEDADNGAFLLIDGDSCSSRP
jgi:hypothetical protein